MGQAAYPVDDNSFSTAVRHFTGWPDIQLDIDDFSPLLYVLKIDVAFPLPVFLSPLLRPATFCLLMGFPSAIVQKRRENGLTIGSVLSLFLQV